MKDFKEHVQKMHSNDDYLFSEEYSVSVVLLGVELNIGNIVSVYLCYKTTLYLCFCRMLSPRMLTRARKQPMTSTTVPRTDTPTYQPVSLRGGACHYCVPQQNLIPSKKYNVCTDDHSRVILTEIPGRPGSDYINANYILVCAHMCVTCGQ